MDFMDSLSCLLYPLTLPLFRVTSPQSAICPLKGHENLFSLSASYYEQQGPTIYMKTFCQT